MSRKAGAAKGRSRFWHRHSTGRYGAKPMRRLSLYLALAFVVMPARVEALVQKAYVANSRDNSVSIIDLGSNTTTATIAVGASPSGISASADGARVYVANAGSSTVSVIDTASNAIVGTIAVRDGAFSLLATPDGTKVYVAGATALSAIDTAASAVTGRIPGFSGYWLAATPDSRSVYVGPFDAEECPSAFGCVGVIDSATNALVSLLDLGEVVEGLAVPPYASNLNLYAAHHLRDRVSVVDAHTNTEIGQIATGDTTRGPINLAATPDGRALYLAHIVDPAHPSLLTVQAIDTGTGQAIATIPFPGEPGPVAITADSSRVYVVDTASNSVVAIDAVTNEVVRTIPVGAGPAAISIPLPIAHPQLLDGNLCDGVFQGTFPGNVTVSSGQDCIFIGGRIIGKVRVAGGNFAIDGASISGNLTISGASTFKLGPDASIGGQLQIKDVNYDGMDGHICGVTVLGHTQIANTQLAIQLGSSSQLLACPGNSISGNLDILGNLKSVSVFSNQIGGNVLAFDNTGRLTFVDNNIQKNLLCQGNLQLVTVSGNTAARQLRQCQQLGSGGSHWGRMQGG